MSTDSDMYDCIVVGAGIIGSWTACMLAERGKKVLLLEQFSLLHTHGSSHGDLRGTSISYGHPFELELTKRSIPYWNKLNDDVGKSLSWKFPLVDICGPQGFKRLEELQSSITEDCEWLDGEQLRQRCATYRFPLNYGGLLQKSCLIIKANKALKSIQERFCLFGGDTVENFKVEEVVPGSDIEVIGSLGRYMSKRLVVCTGGWSKHFLSLLDLDLPLVCKTVLNQHFQLRDGYSFKHNLKCETYTDDGDCFNAFVVETPPGCLRIVYDGGPETTADERDSADVEEVLRKTQEHVKMYWPGLHEKPCDIQRCMYTTTPDCNFICDRHPKYSNVVFAVGFSGAGFKSSPAVAEILADLVEDKIPEMDYTPAKLSRFTTK